MKFIETALAGVFIIESEPHSDDRGLFSRLFCKREFDAAGIDFDPVQMNVSTNTKAHTLRGLHLKKSPHAEQKVVRATRGSVLDVAVDMRPESLTYLQHVSVSLSAENLRSVYIPEGIAHGFMTLEANSHVLYQMGRFYEAGNEIGLRWNDSALNIDWGVEPDSINERDASYPLLGVSAPT